MHAKNECFLSNLPQDPTPLDGMPHMKKSHGIRNMKRNIRKRRSGDVTFAFTQSFTGKNPIEDVPSCPSCFGKLCFLGFVDEI